VTHPAWKRDYARKAARVRAKLSDKALAARLGVKLATLRHWLYRKSRRG
jgi:DNA-binding transcriptional regulator YiaG